MGIYDEDESLEGYERSMLIKQLGFVANHFIRKANEKQFNTFVDNVVRDIDKENYVYLNEMSKILNLMYTFEHP